LGGYMPFKTFISNLKSGLHFFI